MSASYDAVALAEAALDAGDIREDENAYFTLVFQGGIHQLGFNPFLSDSVFGKVVAAGRGNAFTEANAVREVLEAALHGPLPPPPGQS